MKLSQIVKTVEKVLFSPQTGSRTNTKHFIPTSAVAKVVAQEVCMYVCMYVCIVVELYLLTLALSTK